MALQQGCFCWRACDRGGIWGEREREEMKAKPIAWKTWDERPD